MKTVTIHHLIELFNREMRVDPTDPLEDGIALIGAPHLPRIKEPAEVFTSDGARVVIVSSYWINVGYHIICHH
jgi:hypothetical protein